MAEKKTIYGRLDKNLQKWARTIGAVIAIVGALTGALGWVQAQFTNAISEQIDDLKEEMQASDKAQTQAITRLELMSLMKNDPSNIAAIEKMARYYFWDLKGDLYLTQKYSDWCKQYGGDIDIIIGEK